MTEFSNREGELQEQKESGKRMGRWNMTLATDNFEVPEEGYVYTADKESTRIIPGEHVGGWAGFEEAMAEFIEQNYHGKLETGEFFVGVWQDEDEFYHFDIVKVSQSKAEAMAEAEKNGQRAIYDIKNDKIIYIKK
ncbi:MAG: hypothetical protein ABSF55_00640 [Candidatus Staskawiczbacteria bacterium]|jgi:hypothetical protein